MIAFQGGGLYTQFGQRCAAAEVAGGVYMVDICRGLDYFFPNVPLDSYAIKQAYLYNRGEYGTEEVFGSWEAKNQLRRELEALAKTVKAV